MRGTWQTTGGGGGGGLVLAVIAAAVLIGSGAVSAAARALVTIVIVLACVAGLAFLAGTGYLIWRARSDRPGRPVTAPPVYQLPPEPRPQLEESHKPPAIGPGREVHYHFHVSAAELAAIMRRYDSDN